MEALNAETRIGEDSGFGVVRELSSWRGNPLTQLLLLNGVSKGWELCLHRAKRFSVLGEDSDKSAGC